MTTLKNDKETCLKVILPGNKLTETNIPNEFVYF